LGILSKATENSKMSVTTTNEMYSVKLVPIQNPDELNEGNMFITKNGKPIITAYDLLDFFNDAKARLKEKDEIGNAYILIEWHSKIQRLTFSKEIFQIVRTSKADANFQCAIGVDSDITSVIIDLYNWLNEV
jgi:hypothetical protein